MTTVTLLFVGVAGCASDASCSAAGQEGSHPGCRHSLHVDSVTQQVAGHNLSQ